MQLSQPYPWQVLLCWTAKKITSWPFFRSQGVCAQVHFFVIKRRLNSEFSVYSSEGFKTPYWLFQLIFAWCFYYCLQLIEKYEMLVCSIQLIENGLLLPLFGNYDRNTCLMCVVCVFSVKIISSGELAIRYTVDICAEIIRKINVYSHRKWCLDFSKIDESCCFLPLNSFDCWMFQHHCWTFHWCEIKRLLVMISNIETCE